MLVAHCFTINLVKKYVEHPVSTDEGTGIHTLAGS